MIYSAGDCFERGFIYWQGCRNGNL